MITCRKGNNGPALWQIEEVQRSKRQNKKKVELGNPTLTSKRAVRKVGLIDLLIAIGSLPASRHPCMSCTAITGSEAQICMES